jgi:hypothetical protein
MSEILRFLTHREGNHASSLRKTKSRKREKDRESRRRSCAAESEATKPDTADQLLKADHRSVEKLFKQYENATEPSEKQELARSACTELMVHGELEESHFYPACREKNVESSCWTKRRSSTTSSRF